MNQEGTFSFKSFYESKTQIRPQVFQVKGSSNAASCLGSRARAASCAIPWDLSCHLESKTQSPEIRPGKVGLGTGVVLSLSFFNAQMPRVLIAAAKTLQTFIKQVGLLCPPYSEKDNHFHTDIIRYGQCSEDHLTFQYFPVGGQVRVCILFHLSKGQTLG